MPAAGEEVAADAEARRQLTRQMWSSRLKGVRRNVEVWQALLCVRGLVLSPEHDHTTTLKFASLCLKSGRKRWPLLRFWGLSVHTCHTWDQVSGSGRQGVGPLCTWAMCGNVGQACCAGQSPV